MLDIRFIDAESSTGRDAVVHQMRQPRLWIPRHDYPGHDDWVDKALDEISIGKKMSIIALMNGDPAGSVTYQRHEHIRNAVEIKHLSIDPKSRHRLFASFLLRQVEVEAMQGLPGTTMAIGDTKSSNHALLAFAKTNGYTFKMPEILDTNFGHNGVPDVVFTKQLTASTLRLSDLS